MIKLTDIAVHMGGELLFKTGDLTLYPGQKIGITGGNGCGKSTLFSAIMGELQIDEGELVIPDGWKIAFVAQESPAVEKLVIDVVLDGDRELRKLEQQLKIAKQADDGVKQAEIYAEIEAIDGFNAPNRAAKLLHGLGFSVEQEKLEVKTLSGGWRMRLNLAQALMSRSDLLLLDEPTNHLDLDAVFWLESWLQSYPGTLLLISHDRDVLDRVVKHIIHINNHRCTITSGNYSAFERIQAERLAQQQSAYEKQQQQRKQMQSFINRFKAKATKAKQAQSRIKALEKMEDIAPAHVDSPFQFKFFSPRSNSAPLLQIEKVTTGYAEVAILKELSITLNPGDRLALLGRNGAGKSTLMKLLSGDQNPQQGQRIESANLEIGYFAQHQLELLDMDASPLLHMQRLAPDASEQELRTYLGGFAFHGDKALAEVAPFSGGEKARLVLAMIIYQRPNLLLLDEPTNHLDLEMRHALTVALQGYEGALVVVAHDRYLLEAVTDNFLLVDDKTITPTTLNDYEKWLNSSDKDNSTKPVVTDKKAGNKKSQQQKQEEAATRKEISSLERKLEKLEQNDKEINNKLADTDMYTESAATELKQLLQQQQELKQEIEAIEEQLLDLYS